VPNTLLLLQFLLLFVLI